jgi:threonine/homoserine/homoserine lactone efflux protein
MTNIETLTPVLIFAFVATITPGGATTLATASGAHFGFRRSTPMIAGISAGLGSMAAAAAFGLGGLLVAAPFLGIAMKSAGTIYLLWLAVRIAGSTAPQAGSRFARPTGFLGGVWMLWHNPKGWAMTMGAAAAFASSANGPAALAVLLGSTFALTAILSLSLWCKAGQLLGAALRTDRQWHILNLFLSILLITSVVPMWFE